MREVTISSLKSNPGLWIAQAPPSSGVNPDNVSTGPGVAPPPERR